jgi:prepilin-type N-terminal cleavage/methylation domain-containing protein
MDRIKNRYGFTLIEVIIVSIIVAVLSLVAIMLYVGYVREARQNTVENIAASAATILNAASNLGATIPDPSSIKTPLSSNERWTLNTQNSSSTVIFTCPKGATVEINSSNKKVRALLNGLSSSWYAYDN